MNDSLNKDISLNSINFISLKVKSQDILINYNILINIKIKSFEVKDFI